MSRLRRLRTTGKIFFVTCNLLRTRLPFENTDFTCLADAFHSVRQRRRLLLAGYVFMSDHWHAIIVPAEGDDLPRVMNALKVAAMRRINARREERKPLWQARYFDVIVRTVKQFQETLRYMHLNPVERGLASRPEDWRWSSFRCFGGHGEIALTVDDLNLPTDEYALL